MPRVSNKENKNAYFLAREKMGWTREEASEHLGLQPDRIEKIENERSFPYPEEVLNMAKTYKQPDLCNYYCTHGCAIGRQYIPEVKTKGLSRITLGLLSLLNDMNDKQRSLINITADGEISDEEIDDFIGIQDTLGKISATVTALQYWTERKVAEGKINLEKYEEKKGKETKK